MVKRRGILGGRGASWTCSIATNSTAATGGIKFSIRMQLGKAGCRGQGAHVTILTGFCGLFSGLGLFDLGLEMVFIVTATEEDIERVGEGVGVGGERAHAGL